MRLYKYPFGATFAVALALVLLSLCNLMQILEAGGKGKVPIYMPFPIPIPMPMAPPNGGGKFHHGPHGGGGDEEGEVKKIYLLQPMPKPQPHLKGGGLIGPVQTHIHMQSPVQQQQQQQQHQAPKRHHSSSEGDSGEHNHHHHHHSSSSGKSHSDLKILPIVVIPPMAPMPPIQVAPGNSIQHAPRMTLSPHFHNYLVSGSETGGHHHHKKASLSPISHSLSLLQDHKSFSDYGGSGGGALYRERAVNDPKRLGRRATTGMGAARSASEYTGQGTRLRSVVYDDYGDNDYGDNFQQQQPLLTSSYSRRSQLRDRPTRQYQSSGGASLSSRRRTYQAEPSTNSARSSSGRLSVDSIRDIIDQQQQQGLFDDDPYFDSGDISESKNVDCCNERRALRGSNSHLPEASSELPSPIELRDFELSADSILGSKRNSFRNSNQNQLSEATRLDELSAGAERDLSSLVHYDRDFQLSEQQQQQRPRSRSSLNGRRVYSDSRDSLSNEEDEWRFESVKSVTHIGLPETATNSSSSSSSGNSTTILNNLSDLTTTTTPTTTTVANSNFYDANNVNNLTFSLNQTTTLQPIVDINNSSRYD